eukprot:COSAG02_NODE_933_length_15812_cov_68.551709_16_plen_31_part_00
MTEVGATKWSLQGQRGSQEFGTCRAVSVSR